CRGPRRVAAPSAARARGRSRRRPPARIVGPMKLRTVLSLLRSGELGLLLSATGAMRRHHRLVFLAAGTSSGLFARLAKGPVPLNRLADGLLADPSMRDGLEAWLRVGVGLGELRAGPSGYGLRGALARKLADPRHDAAAALVEETARLHSVWILESPARLRAGRRFMLGDQDGRLVARSSRLVEPFVCEVIDDVVPRAGPVRLLEIGCGSAVYIRHAAGRNPELTALGLELQPEVAALAAENVSAWGLARRVAIAAGGADRAARRGRVRGDRSEEPDPRRELPCLHGHSRRMIYSGRSTWSR